MNSWTKTDTWTATIYGYPILYSYQAANPALLPRSLGLGYGYEWNYKANHGFVGVGYHEGNESCVHYEHYYNLPAYWDQT